MLYNKEIVCTVGCRYKLKKHIKNINVTLDKILFFFKSVCNINFEESFTVLKTSYCPVHLLIIFGAILQYKLCFNKY